MQLTPIRRMWDRVENARQDSEISLFLALLYLGEAVTKTAAAGLIAAIEDDTERHRYTQTRRLIRAESLGEWSSAIDDVLTGPASQHLAEEAKTERNDLTQRYSSGAWQHTAVACLDDCLRKLDKSRQGIPFKLDGRQWFALFAELRNRTRGHGAPSSTVCQSLCEDLEQSIRLLCENFVLFARQWAYLHRNLSGKYRVTKLTEQAETFDPLKGSNPPKEWGAPPDGIYIFFDRPYVVELLKSDADASDFFYPNGGFNGKRFELLSYASGNRLDGDAKPYNIPTDNLPRSETQGIGYLDVQGKGFGNLPQPSTHYIRRLSLEQELRERLVEDRHPVITLVGRGGIGKTSLALTVLHSVSQMDKFGAIFWFSARDVDLLPEGPKLVQPHLKTEVDIAKEFVRLTNPSESNGKGFRAENHLAKALFQSTLDLPFLFVFDNFETVRNPIEIFNWLDTHIRLPNKILITTRFREFKGDFDVPIAGMTEQECELLIESTATVLGIKTLLTSEYRKQLFRESDGHPYVIKVLLGEVAKAGRAVKVERIVASGDKILEALFERTYSGLTPAGKQVFLTLCNWRSTVPQLAVESVMLRGSNERLDVEQAIEELRRSSFIDVETPEGEKEPFLTVPLVASVFGMQKLKVSPLKAAVQADTELLHYFGAGQKPDIKHGIGPRIEKLFHNIAKKVSREPKLLTEYLPMLEFVAQRYPPAWLLLASLHEENAAANASEFAKQAVRRYLESGPCEPDDRAAWERLAELCRKTGDLIGELHALVEMSALPRTPFPVLSNAVNRWNWLFKNQYQYIPLASDERRLLAERLLEIAESRKDEADPNDCSRVAWLCLALSREDRAIQFTRLGLKLDPQNEHCRNLAEHLTLTIESADA